MRLQTGAFLDKAGELLTQADKMLAAELTDAAGRTADLAAFHAAQAYLFETTGRLFKKHSSVQGEFGRLIKSDPGFDADLRPFLSLAYNLKATADYETGPDAHVSAAEAASATQTAHRFVDAVTRALPPGEDAPPTPPAAG